MKDFKFEPVAVTTAIQAVLMALLGFGVLDNIGIDSRDEVMLLVGVAAAAGALVEAFRTDRTWLAPLVELFKALVAAAALYGYEMSPEDAAYVIGAIMAVAGLFHQSQVKPLAQGTFRTVRA